MLYHYKDAVQLNQLQSYLSLRLIISGSFLKLFNPPKKTIQFYKPNITNI